MNHHPTPAKTGEKHPLWKGNMVSYGALHDYIKYHLYRPILCKRCGENRPLDLANISGEYKRDFSDWTWLCRRCHIKGDGRFSKLQILHKLKANITNRKKRIDNTSGYTGVSFINRPTKKWQASICKNHKPEYLGIFTTPKEAAQVYDKRARELWGSRAKTNFLEEEVYHEK